MTHMTSQRLLELHSELCVSARDLMSAKNEDYTGPGADRFANFRASQVLGVKPELGLLIRCMDKMMRIKSFAQTGSLAVKDEPVKDAILDVINYMVLLAGMIEESTSS